MAYFDALAAEWATLTGTTAQKLATLNALVVTGSSVPALLSPSAILNAIVPADLAALTATQVSFLTLVLQGSTVNASKGTTIRAAIQTIFAGKTTTLSQLGALVAPFDNPQVAWTLANGYGAPPLPLSVITAAGLS
jgi:hypothetical protein